MPIDKVLITGGAGYIGSHCSRYFRSKGVETWILDDLSSGHGEAVDGQRLICGDIGDGALLDRIFSTHGFDAVVHFAALADVAGSVRDPAAYYGVNVAGMAVLLNAMVRHGARHIVFSSSAATYGEPERVPIDEAHPQAPVNPYGMTKLIGERMLADYGRAYGIKYSALRYFNAAGADASGEIGESHEPEHHILPLIFQTALGRRGAFQVFGGDYDTKDGTCLRDYVHVSDLAEAHFLALEHIMGDGASEAFNLGSGCGYTVLEVIRAFESVSGAALPFEMADRRAGDPARLVASNSRIRQALGWEPARSDIETIISSAWEWEKNRRY
ncbi:MAG: UDP-glucose 4-epimerase GalE [Clostridiales Family XIII bacterium]|nr:UDP-glucose 4-epimerase GalE [Clostridiales Family XIII bacterium]